MSSELFDRHDNTIDRSIEPLVWIIIFNVEIDVVKDSFIEWDDDAFWLLGVVGDDFYWNTATLFDLPIEVDRLLKRKTTTCRIKPHEMYVCVCTVGK